MPDRVFRTVARAAGTAVLVIMALVGSFLTLWAWQALSRAGLSSLTTQAWEPDAGHFGIASVLTGTVLIGLTAVCLALPLSLGIDAEAEDTRPVPVPTPRTSTAVNPPRNMRGPRRP